MQAEVRASRAERVFRMGAKPKKSDDDDAKLVRLPPLSRAFCEFSSSLALLAHMERQHRRSLPLSQRKTNPPKQRAPLAALNGNSEVVATMTTATATTTANAKLSSSSAPCPAPAPAPAQVSEVRENRASAPCTPARRRKAAKDRELEEANGELATRAALLSKQQKKNSTFFDIFPLSLSLSHPSTSAAAAGDDLERGHALGALQGK